MRHAIIFCSLLLSGCFGMFSALNRDYRKVNIYPTTETWNQLEAGAKKLGWKTTRGDEDGWVLTVESGDDQKIEMMRNENICTVAADQDDGKGCSGLTFVCEDGTSVDDCTERFVKIAKASGVDPSTLKFSNRMANTEATGEPYAP